MAEFKFTSRHGARGSPFHGEAWDSEYDSTWEEDERPGGQRRPYIQSNVQSARAKAARDLQTYRHGYSQALTNEAKTRCARSKAALDLKTYRHGYVQARTKEVASIGRHSVCKFDHSRNYKKMEIPSPNLDFYQNKKPFEPNGVIIEDLLTRWKYDELETNHSYIQWLFPIREQGMNLKATPLTLEEIERMKNDGAVMSRFLRAYELMLWFYGIKLQNRSTGEVTREKNYWERFQNLNNHPHNNLRITRILKCLGELGYEHFQAPLVHFFLEETLCKNTLQNTKRGVLDYFLFTVKDKNQRRKLVHFAWTHYKPQDRFICGPREKICHYSFREKKGKRNVQHLEGDCQRTREDKYERSHKVPPSQCLLEESFL